MRDIVGQPREPVSSSERRLSVPAIARLRSVRLPRGGRKPVPVLLAAATVALLAAGCTSVSAGGWGSDSGGRQRTASGTAVSRPVARTGWADSLQSAMPADQVTRSVSPACAAVTRTPGWVGRENARPGEQGFDISTTNAGPVSISLDQVSVACGGTLKVRLSGPAGLVAVRLYRVGWYHGAGGRLVAQWPAVTVSTQQMPKWQSVTSALEVNWAPSLTVPVPPAWTPGFYLVAVVPPSGQPSVAPLVIRDDSGSAPLLVNESVLTWTAYNAFGGATLYQANESAGATHEQLVAQRARTVGVSRPLLGSGYRQMHVLEMPLVQLIERLGPDVSYTTDVDIDAQPSQLLRHRGVVWGGHSEYWTRRMYDAAEAARNAGVNLAFLGGNDIYWQSRLTTAPDGTSLRLTVYRNLADDPISRTDPSLSTVRWSDPPLMRDAAELLGVSHSVINVKSSTLLLSTPEWLFGGDGGMQQGRVVPDLLGGEADTTLPANASMNPPNLQVLGESVMHSRSRWATSTMVYYSAPSGAGVFAAGNMNWVCRLNNACPNQRTPQATQAFVTRVTTNLLLAFAQARAGAAHPSTPNPPMNAATLRGKLRPTDVGTFGAAGAS